MTTASDDLPHKNLWEYSVDRADERGLAFDFTRAVLSLCSHLNLHYRAAPGQVDDHRELLTLFNRLSAGVSVLAHGTGVREFNTRDTTVATPVLKSPTELPRRNAGWEKVAHIAQVRRAGHTVPGDAGRAVPSLLVHTPQVSVVGPCDRQCTGGVSFDETGRSISV